MKKRMLTIIGLTMAAFIGISMAGCHRGPWNNDGPPDRAELERRASYFKARIADKLELTESQKAELDRMVAELQAKHEELSSHRQEFKDQCLDLLKQDHLEAEDITRLIDTRRPDFEELLSLVAEKIAEFHNLLTPEQRAKLAANIESHAGGCPFGR